MESLRHKERDTSATISKEVSLAVRMEGVPRPIEQAPAGDIILTQKEKAQPGSHWFILIYTPPDRVD